MKISIVIPNYNGRRLLETNLPKVIKNSPKCEIIVVDDGSTDGSVEYLKAQILKLKTAAKNLKLKLITNKKNIGFASTVNRGIREASGEIVVLLNTDVYPEEGYLDAAILHFKDTQVFAVGMFDKSIEGNKIVRRGRGMAEWRRGFLIHWKGEVDKSDTFWVSGGSGTFRKSIWQKLGGFDEIYNPFYWEDIDLSFRARKAGYKILFEAKAVVVHEHEKGIIKNLYKDYDIKFISYRNQFLFVWKNANIKQFINHILWLPYHMTRSIAKGDFYFVVSFFAAVKRLVCHRMSRL